MTEATNAPAALACDQFKLLEQIRLVRAWLISRAWDHANRQQFHNALCAEGIRVVTDNEVYEWSGGDTWAYSGGTVNRLMSRTSPKVPVSSGSG